MLASYPRTRPPLGEQHARIYAQEYKKTRGSDKPLMSRVSSGVSGWMHRKVAEGAGSGSVLEIGAGTLNHLPYEGTLAAYDIVEPFTYLFEDHPQRASLRAIFADIREVPAESRYARIISIAALEHLTELPAALARSGLLLEEGGRFQAGIPSEGGFLWGLTWRCSTGLAYYLRNRISYAPLMRHEHINDAAEIIALARHFFGDVRLEYFPLPGLHTSLFVYLDCRSPNRDRCREYLDSGPYAV